MTRPTLYLTNWSSRKLHGPGRKLCAMARPRHFERGDGRLDQCAPKAEWLRAVQNDRLSLGRYRKLCEEWFGTFRLLGSYNPGALSFKTPTVNPTGMRPVEDGDTLYCACARPDSPKRTHPCHLELLAPFLVRAGWDVVLHGRWLSSAGEHICDPSVLPDDTVVDSDGEAVTPEDYGWPEVTP
jgi:hypothetical protein